MNTTAVQQPISTSNGDGPDPTLDTDARTADARVDVAQLGEQLLGRWAELRRKSRDFAADPRMIRIEGQSKEEHRERVLDQMKLLVAEADVLRAFPERLGGKDDAGGNIAGFEELIVADPSLQIKGGVQWGLFAAAILHLGTPEQQDRLLPGAMDVSVPGAFAMTEIGHGSDVAAVGTTATFDPASGDFVLHTPFKAAWKEYLGNAALHGLAAVVFAQLITASPDAKQINHGVHAFYVPIREVNPNGSAGAFVEGVGGADDGLKGGLNGIDNGQLHFTNVRVPRQNLLARYGEVAVDGTYTSSIESPGRRFFTMLGSLVQGRVSLDGAAVKAQEMALAIAVTYGNERRQFAGADPTRETVLMDYGAHQRRLIPLIARAFAGHFAHDRLLDLFHAVFSEGMDTPEARQDLETMAAALKSTSTWGALDTIQTAREACGGAGYMAENRLTGLYADLDVFVTFEGDNTVLLQLVGKRLLSDYAAEFKDIKVGGLARLAVERAQNTVLYRTPIARVVQTLTDQGSAKRAVGRLRGADAQRELLTDRVETMVAELGAALRPATKMAPEKASELFNKHQHELIEAARAHADLIQWEAFTKALDDVTDPGTKQVLTWVRNLYGLHVIEGNLAWYLINGRFTGQRARTVSSYIDRLVARLRPHAQDLVDSFGFGPEHLRATIATGVEAERQDEAHAYYRALRASGDEPITERAWLRAQKSKKR